jgi:hypothetical protein
MIGDLFNKGIAPFLFGFNNLGCNHSRINGMPQLEAGFAVAVGE